MFSVLLLVYMYGFFVSLVSLMMGMFFFHMVWFEVVGVLDVFEN